MEPTPVPQTTTKSAQEIAVPSPEKTPPEEAKHSTGTSTSLEGSTAKPEEKRGEQEANASVSKGADHLPQPFYG
jgi:hypothetical protein